MTTSSLVTARDNLVTLLETSTVIKDVATTLRVGFEDPSASQFPMVDVILGNETNQYDPSSSVEQNGEILIFGAVNGIDLDGLEALIKDIKDLIGGDDTLSGAVAWIRVTTLIRDAGTWSNSACVMTCAYMLEHDLGSA